jgi:hypothetical protein
MQITTVKHLENGYLVDGIMSVPLSSKNSAYIAVENWIIGKTEDWLQLESIFNAETSIHDNWLKIQSYDADLAQYAIDIAAYEADTSLDIPEGIAKPKGYYTQEEVDASVLAHTEWQTGKDAWDISTDEFKGDTYYIIETIILQIPGDMVEPTITPLPVLVPNTVDSQFSLDEIKENKKTELKISCNTDIESNFTSNATGIDYDYESTLKDQINISGAAQANTTVDFTVIDGTGNKLRVSHNATQMQQVFTDGVVVMQTKKNALYILLGNVDSAVDETAINAIVWS